MVVLQKLIVDFWFLPSLDYVRRIGLNELMNQLLHRKRKALKNQDQIQS